MKSAYESNQELRARSGNVKSDSRLVSFLYQLMRDEITTGQVEKLVREAQDPETQFCNGFLANYALDVAKRLQDDPISDLEKA